MFTIEENGREYPTLALAIIGATSLMRRIHRSVVIKKDGQIARLMRY